MGIYKTTYGQSLYDVALHIYGSVEGITDLLVSNENLSLDTKIQSGTELFFTDGYIINREVVAYYNTHNIRPSTGERVVYPKSPTLTKTIEIYVSEKLLSGSFTISGSGMIEIDWGDNFDIERLELADNTKSLTHIFNNKKRRRRKITFYMQCALKSLDFSGLYPLSFYILRPIYIERFTLKNMTLSVESLPLFRGIFRLILDKVETEDLTPLIELKELMELSLIGHVYTQPTIDAYLVGLVENYEQRRNCRVEMITEPSPIGMEAINTIINEPAWNEGGLWEFVINGKSYKAEKHGTLN